MFKERYGKLLKVWTISTIIFLLFIIIVIINPIVTTPNIVIRFLIGIFFVALLLNSIMIFPSLTVLLLYSILQDYLDSKLHLKLQKEVQNLPNEFSEVIFNGPSVSEFIPNEEIECIAKLDANGNIIYKIHVDIEASTTNYKAFLKEFTI